MSGFAVGEVVLVAHSCYLDAPVGMEVTIRDILSCPCLCGCGGMRMYYLREVPYLGCDRTLRRKPARQDWVRLCALDTLSAPKPLEVA